MRSILFHVNEEGDTVTAVVFGQMCPNIATMKSMKASIRFSVIRFNWTSLSITRPVPMMISETVNLASQRNMRC